MRSVFSFSVLICFFGSFVLADELKLEEGFAPIFNGKDLTGWKTKAGDALDGLTETKDKRFKVRDGALVIDEKVKGDIYIYTAKEFGKSVVIRFDFMPGAGSNNDLFLHGAKFDIKKPDVKNDKEGEWNAFEITVKDKKAEYKCNGETIKTLNTKEEKSTFGLRAEFGPMRLKNLRVKEEK
jgi:hypothetical protein